MNLEIIPRAQEDIAEAARYYGEHQAGLDDESLAETEAAAEVIAADPLRFEQVRSGMRRYSLARFPYGIYYRMPAADSIRITVVRHHSRRPGYGMRRK
jgi:plasmid stabilization system protein ParE